MGGGESNSNGSARGQRAASRRTAVQKSLKRAVACKGVGLHSGRGVTLTLRPAPAGHGIIFRRTDMPAGRADIPADWRNVADHRLATTIANRHGASVGTIEHLMAALAGCEIDNALIDVSGPEVPAMDGSARPFVEMIERAGCRLQSAPRRAIRILKPVEASDADAVAGLYPSDQFSIRFEIAFASGVIGRQALELELVNGTFKSAIAGARSFGFEEDVARLRSAGLALGGSLDNAVVISGDRVLNAEGLRFDDEFVRHKILDCLGDLYLAGAPILGAARCVRSGHALNHALLVALFADETAWDYADLFDDESSDYPSAIAAAG